MPEGVTEKLPPLSSSPPEYENGCSIDASPSPPLTIFVASEWSSADLTESTAPVESFNSINAPAAAFSVPCPAAEPIVRPAAFSST